jgi:hypothetical protein
MYSQKRRNSIIPEYVSNVSVLPGNVTMKTAGTHLRRDTFIPQWFQASKAAAVPVEFSRHANLDLR